MILRFWEHKLLLFSIYFRPDMRASSRVRGSKRRDGKAYLADSTARSAKRRCEAESACEARARTSDARASAPLTRVPAATTTVRGGGRTSSRGGWPGARSGRGEAEHSGGGGAIWFPVRSGDREARAMRGADWRLPRSGCGAVVTGRPVALVLVPGRRRLRSGVCSIAADFYVASCDFWTLVFWIWSGRRRFVWFC